MKNDLLYNGMLESKTEYMYIEISKLFNLHNCTYNEIDTILDTLCDIYKTDRECLEYNTYDDLKSKNKTYDCGNDVPSAMNHIV